jgi:DNA-directed RNA polymerase subunit E'
MYKLAELEEIVKIPPSELGGSFDEATRRILKEECEGKLYKNIGMIVQVREVKRIGDGEIVPGDGSVYQRAMFDALVFNPENQEIVEGRVSEIVEFGAFLNFGPLDGLIHVSQVMDDFIDVDLNNRRLVGRESKRALKVGDRCRARIVSLSLNESNPKQSRIGLTMRQPGLGALEWLDSKKDKENQAENGNQAEKEKEKEKETKKRTGKKKGEKNG